MEKFLVVMVIMEVMEVTTTNGTQKILWYFLKVAVWVGAIAVSIGVV